MLKKFFLNTLSSFVGAWIAIALCILGSLIFFVGCFGKMALSSGNTENLTSKSILVVELAGNVEEVEKARQFDLNMLLRGDMEKPKTLHTIVTAIREAAENKNIKGIYLKCEGVDAAPATLHAIREELIAFKKSGKPIYAYGNLLLQSDYYVASVSDSIFLNPQGELMLHGLSTTNLFYKGLLDKLGISFQVFKVGTFKSAVEPYIMENMSEPARAQLDTLNNNLWSIIRSEIAHSRGLKNDGVIDTLINKDVISFRPADFAVKNHLVDRLVYERQINEIFGKLTGKEPKEVSFVSCDLLTSQTDWARFRSAKNQIAILYATGEIAETPNAGINYENLMPQIIELADNDNVKGVVLRVNSPGGSVFGTVQISEALEYLKSKGKPLIVSMGDYAASGGYWISAGADYIFADPMTITGSIGIFGLIPELSGLMEKIGVNVESVETNKGANFPNPFAPMTESQKTAMQRWIEKGYDNFIKRVAIGRNMPEAKVRAIAEGRVWDGATAEKLGLVNKMGSLQDAVNYASEKAGIKDNYKVAVYPEIEPSIWDYLPSSEIQSMAIKLKSAYPDIDFQTIYTVAEILTRNPQQARMPYFTVSIK